jgi:hypothetical protein
MSTLSRSLVRFSLPLGLLFLSSCSSLTLEQVDFAWPVESAIKVDQHNIVEERRYAISFRVAGVAAEEFGDTTALAGTTIRLLRSVEGYYFLTGPKFKNVYVFTPGASELIEKNKIEVTKTGLKAPALNQRPPYVELIDGKSLKVLLSSNHIEEEKK